MFKKLFKENIFIWDWKSYINANPDLKKNWNNPIFAFIHWIFFGILEQRKLIPKCVLCRPKGGINDMLCQLEICYEYCIKYNRFLIIDSPFINSYFFKVKPEYLNIISLDFDRKKFDKLTTVTVFPREIQNRINSYEIYFKNSFFRDKKTNTPIFFNINRSYKEDILVYEQWGGGEKSISFFKKILLQKDIAKEINLRLKSLPHNYVSIHIRNTDYKTNYRDYYKTLKEEMKERNILICTDDYDCTKYTKIFFDNSNVFTISKNIPPRIQNELQKNKSQHLNDLHIDRNADLLGLAFSKKIYHTRCYTILSNGKRKEITSGFIKLAKNLQKNKNIALEFLYNDNTNKSPIVDIRR